MSISRRAGAIVASLTMASGVAACASDDPGAAGSEGFEYGYSKPTGQNPWMNAIQAGAEEVAGAGGGESEVTDAGLDISKAVQQLGRFTTNGKDVVVVAPAQVPEAIQATLTQAKDADIPVLATEWSYTDDPTEPPQAPVDGQVILDRAGLGEDVAAAINEDYPDGTKVIYIGLPFPVTGVDYFEENLVSSLGKSTLAANLDNPTDNAQGALGPLNGALAGNPDAGAIVTYNGASAEAAVQAVKAAGLEGEVLIYNIQADTASMKNLAAGDIDAVWDLNPFEMGEALGDLIVAAATGEPESEWAKTVMIEPTPYTKENASEWVDWAE